MYHFAFRYVERKVELGHRPIDYIDKIFEERSDNIKVVIEDVNYALNILNHIKKTSTKKDLIMQYDRRISKFYKSCSEYFKNIIESFKDSLVLND